MLFPLQSFQSKTTSSALPSTKNPRNETSLDKTSPIVNRAKVENFPLAIAIAIETLMLFQITKEL